MNSTECTACQKLAERCKELETEITKLQHQNTIAKLEHQNTKLELVNTKEKLKHQEEMRVFQAKMEQERKQQLFPGPSILSDTSVPPFAPPTVEHKQIQNQPNFGGCENAFMNQADLSSIPPPTPQSHQKFGSGGTLSETGNQIPRSTGHKRIKKIVSTKPNVETLAKKAKENVPPPLGPPAPEQNFLFPNTDFSLLNALAYAQMNAAVNAGTSTSAFIGEPMPTTVLQQMPSSSTAAYYHPLANIPSASNLQQLQQEKESNGNGADAHLTDN